MPDARAEFDSVYRRHLPAVSAYLARRVASDEVEDLAADVFAIAWRKRDAVTPGEELPWLYRIASYQVANLRRRAAVRASALALFAAPDSAPPADTFIDRDPELAAAWRQLSTTHREVLALVVLDGATVAEAAIALGVSANALSIRLHRAKRALAEQLGGPRREQAGDAADAPDERSAGTAT
ncbi:RNA polymerase sigma factor [Homoserinibacter sp. GY 40078]|uniref:RNA polymerase sigma factor n=1 Tax=Homoserinibacter sp. GY 40078 TaxID=2603275 RepID=UPI0011C8DA81|nr:sigma-70 family RNA polymerase sigma factor [Homoserinibacter sp. GY 40078]TXK17311.1 sigma-70 family RNA polymerase sigma factor [Homoserinibacter sp. GY 40078]